MSKPAAASAVTLRIFRIGVAFVGFFVLPALRIGSRRHVPQHVRLRLFLQHLGGAWIKIGQALALRFDLIPREYCTELLRLLNENPPVEYALVRQVIQEDFGQPPETLFAFFDASPLATASVAQVHVAKTRSGKLLAVKVQRPDAQSRFEADFRFFRMVVALIGIFDQFGGTSLRIFVLEFERYTREELDFENEARNGYRLWFNSQHDPIQVCAEIEFEFCSRRVLAMQLLEGRPLLAIVEAVRDELSDPETLQLQTETIRSISHNFFWCICNQIFRDGFFHADPHPANIFVLADHRIGFVDFGATSRLPTDVRESLIRHLMCIYQYDFEQAVNEMLRILIPTRHTNLQKVRRDLILAFEKYRYGGGDEIADRRKLTRELTIDTMSIVRRNRILMPQSMALYYKTTLTVDAILSELAPYYDPLGDLSTFFIKAASQDRRGPLQVLKKMTLLNASDRLSQLLQDIKTIATPLQLFDGTLQTAQTRAMLYGVCSIAFCVGAFLARSNDSSVFENTTGLNRGWLVYGMLAIAAVVLIRLQRLLRVPRRNQ